MKKLFILTILLLSQFSGAVFADECIEGNCGDGQGTYTFADGSSHIGIWRNGVQIRDICEEMGLRPGTEEFGQCVLKLMD